ncbi:MAG: AAA family ATPase [Crenarchaeota archaeon]|nr:AAA family ATPase [Thermoproteota archaeon]
MPIFRRKKKEQEIEPPPNSIGIVGFKGGVGKTTIAVELSFLLARRGMTPSLIDWDPYNARATLRIMGKGWETECGAWNYVAGECDENANLPLKVKVRREEGGKPLELFLVPPTRRYGEVTDAILEALGNPNFPGRAERANVLAKRAAAIGDILFNDFQVPSWMGLQAFKEIVNVTSRWLIVVVDHMPQSFKQTEHLAKTLFPGKLLALIINRVPSALLSNPQESKDIMLRVKDLQHKIGAKVIAIVPFDAALYDHSTRSGPVLASASKDPSKIRSLRILNRLLNVIIDEATETV